MHYPIALQDKHYTAEIGAIEDGRMATNVNGGVVCAVVDNLDTNLRTTRPASVAGVLPSAETIPQPEGAQTAPDIPVASDAPGVTAAAGNGAVKAPIPGLILNLKVTEGSTVSVGQVVFTMDAMKLKHQICSTVGGKVKEIRAGKGTAVAAHDVIIVIG